MVHILSLVRNMDLCFTYDCHSLEILTKLVCRYSDFDYYLTIVINQYYNNKKEYLIQLFKAAQFERTSSSIN